MEVIRFALLGFGVGTLYALASQGLIAIYRGSGVLNFGLGAIGMVGVYVEWELHVRHGWPFLPACLLGIAVSAAIGALTHLVVMRPLRHVTSLMRVIATLGVLITLQSIAILRYGSVPIVVKSALPTTVWRIYGDVVISADRIILLCLAAVLTLALWLLYRYTLFGIGTTAVAENERAASSLGWSPNSIATVNWAIGSALAGLAAILITPIVTLQPTVMTNLMLAAMAAAMVASFRSFPLALIAGLTIGIAQTEANRFVSQPGFGQAVPFLFIIVWMVLRGQALPLRDYFQERLPTIGSGVIRWRGVLVGVAIGAVLMSVTTPIWIDAFTVTVGVGLVLLSIVVLTGYAGQLSLAQFAMAGFGAWVAGRLTAAAGVPFGFAAVIGVLAAVPLGIVFALPAVRTRGINLAIVTLGLGTAIELMLFGNVGYTGGFAGTQVGTPRLFGWDINSAAHPTRYGLLAVGCLVVTVVGVANIRRGRSGRRLIAVRTNERAAAALGISVPGAKLYAFALSAAIAAFGGIVLAFRSTSISYAPFTSFTSIMDVGLATIGGIGYLLGPVLGGTLAAGGLWSGVFDAIGQSRWLAARVGRRIPRLQSRQQAPRTLPAERLERVPARTLEVRDATVRYGGTTALSGASLTVRPGRVVGLIGPNGAGKTTLIDAVTGFARMSTGSLLLDDQEITSWSATRRARAGLGRSFQSLELFEDSSVFDNLRVACDPRDSLSYVRDLVYPLAPPFPGEVVSAIKGFGLEDDLERMVEDLPYGKRRLLAIARAVATHPSVLLLDEPAAGLGDVETAELASLVRRLAADWGMAVLVIEHDMTFVMSCCDEIVVLDFGQKICEGSPETVRKDPAVIAAYLGEEAEEEHVAHASGAAQPGDVAPGDSMEGDR